MTKYCDLHTHSVFSDGTWTPEEIVAEAERLSLSAVALCDHNTTLGLPRFLAAGREVNVKAVPGAEFSTVHGKHKIHLLGLYIPESAFEPIEEMMREDVRLKEESNVDLARTLTEAGYPVDYGEIKRKSPTGRVNRAHFAEALCEAGYAETIDGAFSSFLTTSRGLYTPPRRRDVMDMIRSLACLGAVPVLAHAFLNFTYEELEAFLPEAKAAGLAGMECVYSTYTDEETELSFRLAERFGLLYSGGSDFHGERKPDISLGTGRGNLRVPAEFEEDLFKRKTGNC